MREIDVTLPDGRTLHAYDRPPSSDTPARLAVMWHHGTPNIGLPPEPLFAAADRLGVRWIGYDRPGYGSSAPNPGRDIASAAADAVAVADALGVDAFAVIGHSGGTPHALACAALVPDRVVAAAGGAGLAPFEARGIDWFAGMGPTSAASLRAAAAGREAKVRHETSAADAEPDFIEADWNALHGEWGWFGKVVGPAMAAGPEPLIDDDMAYVSPWGFDPGDIRAPTLLFHGEDDRVVPASHGAWVAQRIRDVTWRPIAGQGHISVLRHAADALEWLVDGALRGR